MIPRDNISAMSKTSDKAIERMVASRVDQVTTSQQAPSSASADEVCTPRLNRRRLRGH